MGTKKEIKAGDACPQCGGTFAVDEKQEPNAVIDRQRKNAASPAAAERFAQQTIEKASEFGVIHRCTSCGYCSRFKPAKAA